MKTRKIAMGIFILSLLATLFLCCSNSNKRHCVKETIFNSKTSKIEKVKKKVFHPHFFISEDEFESMIINLEATQRARIFANRYQFLNEIIKLLEQPEELTWLVDKKNHIHNASIYEPFDLVTIANYPTIQVNNRSMRLRKLVINDLEAMCFDANEKNCHLIVSSAYRSYNYQEMVFHRWVLELGETEARRVSAVAGTSQHQLGTTIDFNSVTKEFATQDAGKWIKNNGWKYGFSLSYPENQEDITGYDWEPWHYRYIGQAATLIERNWFSSSQQLFLEWFNENRKFIKSLFREKPLFE